MNFSHDDYQNTTSNRPDGSMVPRRISCGPGLDRILDRIDPSPSFFDSHGQLIDYSTFRATFDDGKVDIPAKIPGTSYMDMGHKHEYERVRKSLLKLVPPKQQKHHQEEDSSTDDSEVFFVMKITKPNRLFRRRRDSLCSTVNTSTAFANNITNAHANTTSAINAKQKQQARSSGSVSFFDESETCAHLEDMDIGMDMQMDASNIALAPCQQGTKIQPTAANVDDSAESIAYNMAAVANASSRPNCAANNHESFQTNATSNSDLCFRPRRGMDLRKKRKTMMNWLANQYSARHLIKASSSSSSSAAAVIPMDPQPPTFVKVIYLGGEEEEEKTDDCEQQKLEEQPWPSRCGVRGWTDTTFKLQGTYR